MYCRKCGKELEAGCRFCSNCGLPINDRSTANEASKKEERGNTIRPNKKNLIVAISSVLAIVLVAVLIGIITNLSKNPVKDEDAILEDVMLYDAFIEKYGIEITQLDIVKRQTNEDEKTDYIWLNIKGDNEQFSYTASYEITYSLYNDGWLVEHFDKTDDEFFANEIPSEQLEKLAEYVLESQYSQFRFSSLSETSSNMATLYFDIDEECSNYLKIQSKASLNAYFTPEKGWYINQDSLKVTDPKEVWDIAGVWYYSDDEIEIEVNIFDYDTTRDIVTLNYSCTTLNNSVSTTEQIEYEVGRNYGGYQSDKYPYVRSSKYIPEKNGLKIGNAVADVYLVGDEYSIYGSKTGCGIYFATHDGTEWYYRWLERE